MDEYSMEGIEDILDYFDVDRTYKLIKDQLRGDALTPSGTVSDHLKPLWVRYKEIEPDFAEGITSSVINTIHTRFDTICRMFIDVIAKNYGLSLDEGWIENRNPSDVHSMALILYTFFVLDIESNIKEVLYRYISEHAEELAENFGENLKARKDAPFLTMKKSMQQDYAVIAANINDVCLWILDQMTEEEFFSYLDEEYIPLPFIKEWFENGHIGGNFMGNVYNLFINNNSVRCRIVFDLLTLLKSNHKKTEKEDDTK